MSFVCDDLIQGFLDDSREHLDNIEAQLMELEEQGQDFDTELVNAVFRAAHSIKGGAGMLGLETIQKLAHKLENVLHMVRTKELPPSREVISVLLTGFDKLATLMGHVTTGDGPGIEEEVASLKALVEQGLPEEERSTHQDLRQIPTPGRAAFDVDELTLNQARKTGETLYVVEFDLIHDIHRRKKTPMHIIKLLSDVGRIIDSRLDVAAVGTLGGDYTNRLPLYVLFSSGAFEGALGSLLGVQDDRLNPVDVANLKASDPSRKASDPGLKASGPAPQASGPAPAAPAPAATAPAATVPAAPAPQPGFQGPVLSFGDFALRLDGTRAVLALAPDMTRPGLGDFKAALVEGLAHCQVVVLDWSRVQDADVGCLEMLFSAWRTFVAEGKSLRALADLPENVQALADTFGFTGNLLQNHP